MYVNETWALVSNNVRASLCMSFEAWVLVRVSFVVQMTVRMSFSSDMNHNNATTHGHAFANGFITKVFLM